MAYTSSYTGAEIDEGIGRASSHASRHAIGGADELSPYDIGAVELDSYGYASPVQTSSRIIEATANKTLALTDSGCLIIMNSSSNLTVTVPTNANVAFPVGTEIEVVRGGTGNVTFSGATGVTVNSVNSIKTISDQYASCGLKKIDTNVWLLTGSLA